MIELAWLLIVVQLLYNKNYNKNAISYSRNILQQDPLTCTVSVVHRYKPKQTLYPACKLIFSFEQAQLISAYVKNNPKISLYLWRELWQTQNWVCYLYSVNCILYRNYRWNTKKSKKSTFFWIITELLR